MSFLIAIDQSTSATKVLLVDARGTVIDSATAEHRQHYPQPGWVEHDASEIWNNLRRVCHALCQANQRLIPEVVGVSITNQRETFLVFDRQSGEPLERAIVWQCRRGDAICEQLRGAGGEQTVTAKTGLRIDSYFSGPKITWLMRNGGPAADALRRGTACVGTIDAYLIHRLTGGQTFATDHTNASRTLLMDVGALRWDAELCELFEAPLDCLPEIRESGAKFGQTDLAGALPRAVPICGVLGDSQASLFAQRCYSPGDVKATFGSGTSVLVNVGHEFQPPPERVVAAVAWVIAGRPTYAWEGLINYSAATLAWLRDQLGLISSIDEVEPLAASVDSSEGVFLVPAFSGMGAPYWNADARAAIVGMSGFTSKAHVVRAALDSIALQVADVLRSLSASGAAPTALNVDGGPTRNRLLMQMVADVSGRELAATEETNLSALGAAMAGMLGLGLVDSTGDLAKFPREVKRFTPALKSEEVERLQAGWRVAVARVVGELE